MSKGKSLGILAALVAAALVFTAVAAGPTLAAKGGGRGGRGGGTPNTGTCSVAPNPVAQWSVATISGSGFAANATVGYTIAGSGGTGVGFTTTDDFGRFSFSGQVAWLGTNTVTISGGGASATCTFEVV